MAAPVIAVWWLTRYADSQSLSKEKPAEVEVLANDKPIASKALVAVERGAAPLAYAPAWAGVVTSVDVAPGDVITTGTSILSIDGVPRIAAHTAEPFYRAINEGATGSDVADLNTLLGQLGFAHGSGSKATAATVKGIGQLGKQLVGLENLTSFDPGWVVWIPNEQMQISEVKALTGGPAPASGTVVLEGRAPVVAAWLTGESTSSAAQTSDGASESDPDETSPTKAAPNEAEVTVAPEGAMLTVGEMTVPLEPDRTHIAPEGLAILSETAAPEVEYVEGLLTTQPSPGQWIVPPAAVFSGDGRLCVLVTSTSQRTDAVEVAIVTSTYVTTVVTGDLTDGDTVLLSPPAGDRRCG